jgi:hypothetical protein
MIFRICPGAFLILGIAVGIGPARGQDEAAARAAFQATDTALARHSDGFFLDDDPAVPALLEQEWSVVRQWAVAYLNAHPAAIVAAFGRLSSDLGIEAVWLDPRTILVSASRGEMGTVFIVAAPGNRFAVAWTVAGATPKGAEGTGLLAAWSVDRARDSCRKPPPGEAWLTCGALHGAIGKLPDERGGTRRFYVDATYAQGWA